MTPKAVKERPAYKEEPLLKANVVGGTTHLSEYDGKAGRLKSVRRALHEVEKGQREEPH